MRPQDSRYKIYSSNESGPFIHLEEIKLQILPPDDEKRKRTLAARRMTLKVIAAFTIYATVRYNVLSGVSWTDWPVFVVNKIIALTSLSLLFITVINYFFRKGSFNSKVLYYAGMLALLHSLVSVTILSPSYYPKLYENSRLMLNAVLSIIMGITVMIVFYFGGRGASAKTPLARTIGLSSIAFFSGLHAALLGFKSWFTPELWPGFLPPLTLISFLMGAGALGIALTKSHSSRQQPNIKSIKTQTS